MDYIFRLIFEELLQVKFDFTTKEIDFEYHIGAKLNYSELVFGTEPFVYAHSLLFQTTVLENHLLNTDLIEQGRLKGFFKTTPDSLFEMDIFASAFFLVSRYEEYWQVQKDKHGRYESHHSLASKNGFLDKPMVHYYALELAAKLKTFYPEFTYQTTSFKYLSTVDVDFAFCYLHKGIKRNVGGIFKDIFNLKKDLIKERFQVLTGMIKDPFDTFEYLEKTAEKFQIPLQFFWLLGRHGEWDKNISVFKKAFKSLIKSLAKKHATGIHFSYASHKNRAFEEEKNKLEEIAGKPITKNRFHFLKFDIPKTFQREISAGIEEDYSMGYASQNGFRASIAVPFPFFDLWENKTTSLKIVPFMYMDVTFNHYQKSSIEEAMLEVENLLQTTAEVGGQFVSIWHNNSLCEKHHWVGWRKVYEFTHSQAKKWHGKN